MCCYSSTINYSLINYWLQLPFVWYGQLGEERIIRERSSMFFPLSAKNFLPRLFFLRANCSMLDIIANWCFFTLWQKHKHQSIIDLFLFIYFLLVTYLFWTPLHPSTTIYLLNWLLKQKKETYFYKIRELKQ